MYTNHSVSGTTIPWNQYACIFQYYNFLEPSLLDSPFWNSRRSDQHGFRPRIVATYLLH